MERYIAVDNVCAWPNLTLLPNGEIIATIFNQPCHGRWEGDVECWSSADGRFWEKRGVPAPHEPATNRMNVAAGLACNGDLIVLASGWSHRPPKPADVSTDVPWDDRGTVLEPWVCRSSDNGRTWARASSVIVPDGMKNVIPFGNIHPDADGNLGASFYGRYNDPSRGRGGSWFFRSADDGRSWSPVSVIGEGDYNETDVLHLGNGAWLATARKYSPSHLDLYASTDNGRTWALRGPVTLSHQHPSHLMRMADGRILLGFGYRNPGLRGIGARFSNDEGKTWGPPHVLVTYNQGDGGYPATVQLEDGTLVTAYYARTTPSHERYHMGVIRWQAEPRGA